MNVTTIIFSGFLLALAAPFIYRILRSAAGNLMAAFPAGLFLYFLSFIPHVTSGGNIHEITPWIPSLNIHLSFYMDGLSLLFALLITGIGTAVFVYAASYLQGNPNLGRFYLFLVIFMTTMLGVVLSDNMITLFIFWELTSLSSYFLIGFEHEKESARSAALQSLLVTGIGGLALLAGFILLSYAGGSMDISSLIQNRDLVVGHELYTPILALIFIGAFTKSAQFPFHFWLPNAMEAPTPVSAYLHSATMVKAGVYLIARLTPVLGNTDTWSLTLMAVGTITMLSGAYLAYIQTFMKRFLAYSTVSSLGILMLLIGIGSKLAITAAMVFLTAHSLYKGALFMVAGIIYHETGEKDVKQLGGLYRLMPYTAAAGFLAAFSMAGLPPFIGFIGKELIYDAAWSHSKASVMIVAAAVLANMLIVAVAVIVGLQPFFGEKKQTTKPPHEASGGVSGRLWAGPLILALSGLLFGLFPIIGIQPMITATVQAVYGTNESLPVNLSLWHGFNMALLFDILAVTGGFAVFFRRNEIRQFLGRFSPVLKWGPDHWYHSGLKGILAFAGFQTRILQNGKLRYYLAITILSTVGLLSSTMIIKGLALPFNLNWGPVGFLETSLLCLILFSTVVVIFAQSRLGAVAALGVIGFCVALIFIVYGAPDLAMTQFVIETLMVILLVFVLHHLPPYQTFTSKTDRVRDAIIAIAGGALMSILVLFTVEIQFYEPVSIYFLENSYLLAHGRNIVNTILVDFRGFDTLGEITVLAIAALGVHSLLKLRPVINKKNGKNSG